MKIALAQINTANGDLDGNEKKIRLYLERTRREESQLTIFPELALVGYPPRDFLFRHGFIQKAEALVAGLARDFSDLNFILGSVEKNQNVAHVISSGGILATCKKNLLPNYDVFDERRYFKPGSEIQIVEIAGKKIAVSICEDIWAKQLPCYETDPVENLKEKNIDCLVNLSASPFESEKFEKRMHVVAQRAKNLKKPVVYVNLVGGNDELIFDGGSFAVNPEGEITSQAPFFQESLHCLDLSEMAPISATSDSKEDRMIGALTLGLRDFVRKCGFRDVTLGLSGGIDSALVLLLAIEAFGKEHVHPVFMPSRFTSQASKEDVSNMISKFKMPISLVPINELLEVFEKTLRSSISEKLKDLTLENIQSRIRGNILMAHSAEKNAMVINTGNKSEIAVGYCTLYGDTIGGVSPLGDLYKHQVYALAQRLNQKHDAIPKRVFSRAPSAELRDNQKDSDRLPAYDILDPLVMNYIEQYENPEELVKKGFSEAVIDSTISLITQSEFKRKQMPPILRVTEKAFGTGRRMPIAGRQYEV